MSHAYKQGATTLDTLTYTYDAAGNRIKTGGTFARSNIPPALTTITYNANNQQLTFGATTETYDLNGNLATSTEAGVMTTYTWNARNQLTGISRTGLTASFTYDSFGRRTGRTVNGTVTNYVYDGLNPIQEKNGATVTANLLTGLGIDEFFTRTDGVGVRALLPDALGSTVALGDGTGTLQTQYTYEPFGFTTQTGAASTNSYKYTGREDDGSGLMYYRARYYQPRFQRFIAEDPIGFYGGDANLYVYVGNNPINFIDPFGLEAQLTVGTNLFLGSSLWPFIFPGVFGGGGMNVGITSSGQVIIQFQATGSTGVGVYAGVGVQGGISRSDCVTQNGFSTATSFQVDANAGWGPSAGGTVQYAGGGNAGINTGVGRLGAGFGVHVSAGVTTTTTYAVPIPFLYPYLNSNAGKSPCGCK